MSDNGAPGPSKESFWPSEESGSSASSVPRTSILKFGALSDVLTNAGKLAGQAVIAWVIWGILGWFLVDAVSQRNDLYVLIAKEIAKLGCSTISVFLVVRILDDSDLATIGLKLDRSALLDFVFGFGVAFGVLALELWLAWATGWVRITNTDLGAQPFDVIFFYTLLNLVIFMFVGWSEELLSRGFHLRIISKGLNRPLGIVLSSVIFAYLHHDNPDVTLHFLTFIFVFGLLAALALLRTGQLWLAIGLHAGWDFFVVGIAGGMQPIFGTGVFHILDLSSTNPYFPFGAVEIPALVFLAILVYFYTAKRKPEIHGW